MTRKPKKAPETSRDFFLYARNAITDDTNTAINGWINVRSIFATPVPGQSSLSMEDEGGERKYLGDGDNGMISE